MNLVSKVERRANNGVTETMFCDYKGPSESKSSKCFPGHIIEKRGGVPVWDITVDKVDVETSGTGQHLLFDSRS